MSRPARDDHRTYDERALARLDAKIQEVPEAGCWIWTGALTKDGYGHIGYHDGSRLAHRLSFVLHRGPIPDGLQLDHLCRTPSCVNPWHLEAVTHAENMRRTPLASKHAGGAARAEQQRAKTHCPKGHPYDEQNTVYGKTRGNRSCRACAASRRER